MTAKIKSRLKRTIIFLLFSVAVFVLSIKLPVARNAFAESHFSGINLLQQIAFSAALIFSGVGVAFVFHALQNDEKEKAPIILDGLLLIAIGNLLVSFSTVFERMLM